MTSSDATYHTGNELALHLLFDNIAELGYVKATKY